MLSKNKCKSRNLDFATVWSFSIAFDIQLELGDRIPHAGGGDAVDVADDGVRHWWGRQQGQRPQGEADTLAEELFKINGGTRCVWHLAINVETKTRNEMGFERLADGFEVRVEIVLRHQFVFSQEDVHFDCCSRNYLSIMSKLLNLLSTRSRW